MVVMMITIPLTSFNKLLLLLLSLYSGAGRNGILLFNFVCWGGGSHPFFVFWAEPLICTGHYYRLQPLPVFVFIQQKTPPWRSDKKLISRSRQQKTTTMLMRWRDHQEHIPWSSANRGGHYHQRARCNKFVSRRIRLSDRLEWSRPQNQDSIEDNESELWPWSWILDRLQSHSPVLLLLSSQGWLDMTMLGPRSIGWPGWGHKIP